MPEPTVAAEPAATSGGSAPAGQDPCLSVGYGDNSAETNAIFERRGLQGGGYTWEAIFEALIAARVEALGPVEEPTDDMPGFGAPMAVRYGSAETWYLVDAEGDGLAFCAGHPELLAAIRADYERANADVAELERLIDLADPE